MVSGKTSEELPPGWKEYVKVKNGRKTKYFINSATGQKLYSKKSVFCSNSLEISQGSSPSTSKAENGSLPCKSEATPDDVKTNESQEWLPHGWTVESRTRKSRTGSGSVYKIYTEPLSGSKFYSKPQVMRYLQRVGNKNGRGKEQLGSPIHMQFEKLTKNSEGMIESMQTEQLVQSAMTRSGQISENTPLEHPDMSQSVEGKISLFGKNENVTSEPAFKENDRLDELPPGHTKEIKTRGHVHGKGNTSQSSESLECKNHIPGENENDLDKPSLKIDHSDAQQNNALDDLPPGWIKETKIRKCGRGLRQDPYYIDTASGYAFRSKKDVTRYLDSGDINFCAIKPQKWDVSKLKLIKEENHPSTSHVGNKSGESVARELFISQEPENGEESSQNGTIIVAEAENSKGKDKEKDNNAPALATMLTTSAIIGTRLRSETVVCDNSGENSGLKAEGSKQDVKIVHGNMAVNGTDTDGFHEEKLTENCSDSKMKTDSRKSRKIKPLSTPGRSSKRLAGHEPEVLPNFSLTERALRAAIRKPHETGADRALSKAIDRSNEVTPQHPFTQADTAMSSSLVLNTAADDVPLQPVMVTETTRSSDLAMNTVANKTSEQPVVTEAETMVANHASASAEASVSNLQNNFKMPSENQVLQQTTGLISERQVEENPMTQSDYWSDPCWDFAFKTLTGAIPLDETLTIPGCFPQPTYTQENLTFGLPEFELPPIFQNNVLQTAPVQNNVPSDQLSTNPTMAPSGNMNLPGCSSQPSLEAQSKDYQTKVKS